MLSLNFNTSIKAYCGWECKSFALSFLFFLIPCQRKFYTYKNLLTETGKSCYNLTKFIRNESTILEDFAQNLIAAKRVPKSISVADDRTEALLSKFCEVCDIKLNRVKDFTKLHETEAGINGEESVSGSFGRFMQMVDTVQMLPEEALTQFPQEFRDMFMDMAKSGLLPPETVEKMKKA